jgi:hypothetical protein
VKNKKEITIKGTRRISQLDLSFNLFTGCKENKINSRDTPPKLTT